MKDEKFKDRLGEVIRQGSSVAKIVCGYMLIDLFAKTSTWLFLVSGLLLLIGGLNYLVPFVLDEVQNYVVTRARRKKG